MPLNLSTLLILVPNVNKYFCFMSSVEKNPISVPGRFINTFDNDNCIRSILELKICNQSFTSLLVDLGHFKQFQKKN